MDQTISQVVSGTDLISGKEINLRAEIDTSTPFESVKEAVSRFGGIGYWKPNKLLEHEHEADEISFEKLEEQAFQLENELTLKQKETLDILQELESTRTFVEELKAKLQKEVSETKMDTAAEDDKEDKENNGYVKEGLIEAQRNLTKTTNGIAQIRASVEVFNMKLKRERLSLERLTQNSLKMSSIEEQLNQTTQRLHGSEIVMELQNLNSEAEKFKQMGEAAKSEFLRTISKIERKKAKIKTAEIKLAAAAKMKEATRVAEAIALTDIKVLPNHENSLKSMEILRQVKEATREIKSTKLSLEEALKRMEVAKKEKVNGAMKKWRRKHDENGPLESCPIGVNGPKLIIQECSPVLKPTLSIGQILSRKLFLQEELMTERSCMKRKVSLAEMLGKQNQGRKESDKKQCSRKRKKSGFARFSLFLAKQTNQKRKKPTPNLK